MKIDPQQQRYQFIELLLFWEGSFNNKSIQNQFGVSRQQASKDIKLFQKQYHHLQKDTHHQYYVDSVNFEPKLISKDIDIYFNWLLTKQCYFELESGNHAHFVTVPQRQISPSIMRTLTQAIRQQKKLEADYVSVSNPEHDGRIFHPHHLVKTGSRWHVRGYCEKARDYRDFVLSRFQGELEIIGDSDKTSDHDSAWNTMIEIVLSPDVRLSPERQAVLAHDYQMTNNQLIIPTRAALATYLLKDMQVNIKFVDRKAEAQQLMLVNQDDIKQWLFDY